MNPYNKDKAVTPKATQTASEKPVNSNVNKHRAFRIQAIIGAIAVGLTIQSCSPQRMKTHKPISEGHIHTKQPSSPKSDIPEPVTLAPVLPPPNTARNEPLHTVVVHDVPVKELLFSLARDVDMNLDIDEDVDTRVTLNAINQTMPAILNRIAEAGNLHIETQNQVLRVSKDMPFLRNYRIDYLNMARSSKSGVSVSSQINSTGQGAVGAREGSADNNSSTSVTNLSENSFWATLKENILAIIAPKTPAPSTVIPNTNPTANTNAPANPTPPAAPSILGAVAAAVTPNAPPAATPAPTVPPTAPPPPSKEDAEKNIMVNQESGVIGVRATHKQHEEIQAFLDEVLNSARRQVLIEATIAEVTLSDGYQAGIDWSVVNNKIESATTITSAITPSTLVISPNQFSISSSDADWNGDALQSTLSALATFGDVRIMSSPKVMALNNQTALLKVVDNLVYFTSEVNIDNSGVNGAITTYETTVNTVPVGFVMSVTPYINDSNSVSMNVRPTISRVVSQVLDPNPALKAARVSNLIPVIQVRELESILKVSSGDIAIIGGLMQDDIKKESQGIPLISKIPVLGALFRYDEDKTQKTELVIFIKPVVIHHASVEGDLSNYEKYLPSDKNRQ